MTPGRQPPLPVTLRVFETLSSFYPGADPGGPNAHALTAAAQLVNRVESPLGPERSLYLWGPAGCGKSHLLYAACHEADRRARQAMLLSLARPGELDPRMLDDLEHLDLVCLDRIDAVARGNEWERALFGFIERAHGGKTRVLVSANCPPDAAGFAMPELTSRLAWGLVLPMVRLCDEELGPALQLRSAQLGLDMPQAVADYLIRSYRRDFRSLVDLLARLDEATLAAQRRLSVPFVRAFMRAEELPK